MTKRRGVPRLVNMFDPRKLSLILKGGFGERPAEDSNIRDRVGGQIVAGPFAGSNPALGTIQPKTD